jgi:hypothetical protein
MHVHEQDLWWAMKGTTELNGSNETMREQAVCLLVSQCRSTFSLLSSPTTGVAQFLVSLFSRPVNHEAHAGTNEQEASAGQ